MQVQMILIIFTTILISSCGIIKPVVLPIPRYDQVEICPPVFIPVDEEKSIYKVHCRCANYDINTSKFTTKFIESDIKYCDRAYGIVTEDFLEIFEPTIKEIEEWYQEMRNTEKKIKEYADDGDYEKAREYLKNR